MALSIEQRLNHGSRHQRRRGRVLQKYGYLCQLCRERIDPTLSSRHPLGLTFDHIVPIGRGGSRLATGNLWPAHRACNQAKAAQLPSEASDVPTAAMRAELRSLKHAQRRLFAENARLRAENQRLRLVGVAG